MHRCSLTFGAILFGAMTLAGCYVPNRSYRTVEASLIQVPPPQHLPAAKPQRDGPPCSKASLAVRPCLAFLEFDDMGEQWTQDNRVPDPTKPDGCGSPDYPKDPSAPIRCTSELTNAVEMVREAVEVDKKAIIVTFTHGWKHNAKVGDTNIEGFKQALNFLHDNYGRVVVGIYISWRGNLVSSYEPVRQNFSYFNREAAATRIPGASATDAFIRIDNAAHPNSRDTTAERPLVIFVGHSFGALFLERALGQAMIRQVDSFEGPHQKRTYRPMADLTIFVNSAAAATEAKQALDFLANNRFQYNDPITKKPKPLVLSVSSSGDAATRVAMPVGHGLPFIGYKIHGSFRDQDPLTCFAPEGAAGTVTKSEQPPSQGSFFLSTAAHMPILQSHELVACTQPPDAKTVFTYTMRDNGQCFQVREKADRCNGTPYWIMEIDPAIVPDHSTIFTQRFIEFLVRFLPPPSEVEQNRHPALTAVQ